MKRLALVVFGCLLAGCATVSPLTGEKISLLSEDSTDVLRRHEYLAAHPETSQEVKDAILRGTIRTGMTKEEVIASWGDTYEKNLYSAGEMEQWIYKRYQVGLLGKTGHTYYVYFLNDVLKDWQRSAD